MNMPRLELPTPQMRPWLPMCEVTGICQHKGLPRVKARSGKTKWFCWHVYFWLDSRRHMIIHNVWSWPRLTTLYPMMNTCHLTISCSMHSISTSPLLQLSRLEVYYTPWQDSSFPLLSPLVVVDSNLLIQYSSLCQLVCVEKNHGMVRLCDFTDPLQGADHSRCRVPLPWVRWV